MRILLIAYDNGSYISPFPHGLSYVASVFQKKGAEVIVYNQDIYHYPESHLKHLLDHEKFDAVGLSVIAGYYQYHKLLKISKVINNARYRPFFILGGHGPAPEPAYFLKKTKADVIVIGEGEMTAAELVDVLNKKKKLSDVKGIAYMEKGNCVITIPRPLIQNIDTIDFPAYKLFPINHYSLEKFAGLEKTDRCLTVLSGRGCIFQCNFCYRMDKGFRPRSIENILEELKMLQMDYNLSAFHFNDELLMSSVQRTTEICEGIIKSKMKFKWICNGRLNFAIPMVLKLMKKAGCVFINYGIESLDQKALNTMKKFLTVKMIHDGIRNTLDIGIHPGFNIIFGNIGETKYSLREDVKFLLKYDDHAQLRTIRPVTPYPGSPLYYYALEKGLLKDVADFYENKHKNSDLLAINFTNLTDKEFHKALYNANKKLITAYQDDIKKHMIQEAEELYIKGNTTFRGFRQL